MTSYYKEGRSSLTSWYNTSPGVANLRKLILENEYHDATQEHRTIYQIDRFEFWRLSTATMTTLAGGIAAYSGWNVGTARFNEVKELEIYSSKKEMFRQRHSWQTMAALAYATPTVIRTFVMMTFLTGIPPLVGVYYNDTDYVASYAVSGTVGGILVSSLLSSRDFGGIRQKLVAGLLALPPALGLGCLAVMSQKYDTYVHYDMYKKRWRNIDPLWSEFVEKVEQEKALKEAEGIVESESLQKNSEV